MEETEDEAEPDATAAAKLAAMKPRFSWRDSYSIGGKCYCDTTYDHEVGKIMVTGPGGQQITVREACELAGEGPETIDGETRIYYNDIQCGNGPANDYGDEQICPGRVDLDGSNSGCLVVGPKWDLGEGMIQYSARCQCLL